MHRGFEQRKTSFVGCVEFGFHAEGEGDVLTRDVAAAQAEGEISPTVPILALARMLAAALKEAGVMIATAPDPAAARAEASAGARRLLSGLLASPANSTPRRTP